MVRRNRISALATSRRVAWKRRSSRFRASAEQGAHVFLEHGERRVGQSGFQAGRLNREDRRPPRRFEIGDVLDGHDRALVDQPGEAGGVDSSGARGVDPQPARIFETIQQRDDVGGRGRLRIIPQPGEAGAAQLRDRPRATPSSVSRSESDSPAARVSKVFFRARARAANPIRSSTAAAGSRTPFARRWASIAWTMGSPRSVAHAASVPTRRQARQSANPKLRRAQVALQFDHMLAAGLVPPRVIAEQRRDRPRSGSPGGTSGIAIQVAAVRPWAG